MSLIEMQSCLARLYVDEAFLKLFELAPAYVLGQYELDEPEREAVGALDVRALRSFASSLRVKRKQRFDHAYPLTFKIGGATAERYYHRFCSVRGFRPGEPFSRQALDLGAFFEESFAGHAGLPPYAADLARYERLLLSVRAGGEAAAAPEAPAAPPAGGAAGPPAAELLARRPRRRSEVRVEPFGWKIKAVIDALAAGAEPGEVPAGTFHYAFSLEPPGRARGFEVTQGSAALLELCDGGRTLAEVVEALERRFARRGLGDGIVANAGKLLALGLLELRDGEGEEGCRHV